MYRDAQLIYEQAAALQIAHAAHERDAGEKLTTAHHRFTATAAPAAVTPTDLGNRYAVLARKEALADQRERAADARERTADDRGQIADAREHAPTSAIGSPMPATGPPMTGMLSLPPWEDQIDARERRFDEAKPPYHRFAADQPAQLALVHAAIVRTRQRFATEVRALQRDDVPTSVDETAIDDDIAGSQRRQAAEPERARTSEQTSPGAQRAARRAVPD